MPKRFGFGLGFNTSRLVGGGTPPVPSGFVSRYLSSLGWSLVTGDNIEQWDDQSANNNDLTQAISVNQPTLFEYDVVKQSTLANMPTLVDTGGGVLAVEFDGDLMTGLTPQTGDFTYEFDLSDTARNSNLLRGTTSARFYGNNSGALFLIDDVGNNQSFGNIEWDTRSTLVLHKSGDNLTLIQDGVVIGNQTRVGSVFSFTGFATTGLVTSTFYSFRQWNSAVSDPTNITETPDFELLPQASLMRNDSNATPSTGDQINAWLSTTHKPYQNEIQKTGNNKYMGGYPTQSSDFSYVYAREQVDIQAQDKRIASSSTTSAEIGFDASEQLYMIADDGTRYTWTGIVNDGTERIYIPCRDGNTLSAYDGNSEDAQTFDVTGKTFTIDRWGSSTLSSNGYSKEPVIYPFKLNQTQVDYWSYLRNQSGDILLPPILPS